MQRANLEMRKINPLDQVADIRSRDNRKNVNSSLDIITHNKPSLMKNSSSTGISKVGFLTSHMANSPSKGSVQFPSGLESKGSPFL